MNTPLVVREAHSHIVLLGDGNPMDEAKHRHGSGRGALYLYTPVDIAFFESKGLQKSNEALQRAEVKFKFYIDTRPGGSIMRARADVQEFIEQDEKNGLTPVVFNNNMSPLNHIPMTAWILCHRIPHTLLFADKSAYAGIDAILAQFQVPNYYRAGWLGNPPEWFHPISMDEKMLRRMMTMRSARLGIISSGEDLVSELFAQHLLTGSIKLQPSLFPGDYLFNQYVDELQHQVQEFINQLYNRLVNKPLNVM